jgi:hypothetical protein
LNQSGPMINADAFGLCPSPNRCGPEIASSFQDQMAYNCSLLCPWWDQGGGPDCVDTWLRNVSPGGLWDYKLNDLQSTCQGLLGEWITCPDGDCSFTIQMCDTCLRKDVLGNMNYGYTGRCLGLSLETLLAGGHFAAQHGHPEDECDQASIRAGYWLRGNLLTLLIAGPNSICTAITLFDLDTLCGRPDCPDCPCSYPIP